LSRPTDSSPTLLVLFDEPLELPAPERVAESFQVLHRRCARGAPAGIFLQSEVAPPAGA
jgi:hypothetical protein